MALNPLRSALTQSGLTAFGHDSPFKAEADAALASFRGLRNDLERQVRQGHLTPKVARQRAVEAAARLRAALHQASDGYSPVPRAFLDRLIEADTKRRKARENRSLEGLQRETNRLLRDVLLEQQMQSRATEFEGRAFVRPITGGPPAPTLDSLLAFHETAVHAGDDAAQEWARRQLEAYRNRVLNTDDQRQIDRACDRPDRVNPRLVGTYVEAMAGHDADDLTTFVTQALDSRDANACIAAFVLARSAPEGASLPWVRQVLNGLDRFPDAALTSLRSWEAEGRRAEADAARAQADYAIAMAEAEARFPDLDAPRPDELARQDRLRAKPVAAPDEPVGLALQRRGMTEEEFAQFTTEPEPAAE